MSDVCVCAKEIQKDQKALRLITPAYAGRGGVLTAVLQYTYQAIALSGEEAALFERIAAEKLRHLHILGALVRDLGANPVFTACPPYPVSYFSASGVDYAKSLPAMLDADIRLERASLERYAHILEAVENPHAARVVSLVREECMLHLGMLRARLERV